MGTRQRLLRIFIFWVLLGLASLAGGARLVDRVNEADRKPVYFYEQPVWSSDENQVAYFRLTGPYGTVRPDPKTCTRELFRANRLGDPPIKVADFPAEPFKLGGFFQGDKQLLVRGGDTQSQILLVDVATGAKQEIPYQKDGLGLVGIGEGQLFFEHAGEQARWSVPGSETPTATPSSAPTPVATPTATPSPELTRSQAVLVSWTAGSEGYKKVLAIPYESETLTFEEAVPSPDLKWVALVLKVGQKAEPVPARFDRALWMYRVEDGKLSWSGIKVPVDSMKIAWSPDSKGLVASTHTIKFCDLYVTFDIEKGDFRKLHTTAGPLALGVEPFWPRDQHYFLLLRAGEIFQFDPEAHRATPLQLQAAVEHQAKDFTISPRATWAAYLSTHSGLNEISCVSLSTKQTHVLVADAQGSQGRDQWWYLLGDGLRQAYSYWTGTPPGPAVNS